MAVRVNDVFVRCIKLPHFVKGQILLDENGDYNVYINDQMSCDMQRKTLQHELNHIENDDFNNNLTISDIERLTPCF